MSLLLLATVLVGFARSYFLVGMIRAPLPNLLIHLHAIAFSCWIFLLIGQATLIATHKVELHRKAGLFGFILACVMVGLGVMAAANSMTRMAAVGPYDSRVFFAVPMSDIFVFAVLIFLAYRWRHDPAAHKRLVLIASITIVDAATGRAPMTRITDLPYLNNVFTQLYVVLLAAFDWWSMRKIHRVTMVAGVFSIVTLLIALPIGSTHVWMTFATWVRGIAKTIQG